MSLGVALATGSYDQTRYTGDQGGVVLEGPLLWLNMMVGVEYRWDAGVELRLYGGYSQVVHSASCERYERPASGKDCAGGSPGLALAIGYAF